MSVKLPPRFVPIPNALFDDFLPTLTDTELRVLLVVFRATIGWRETAPDGTVRFKERDWINHRLFSNRTGRSHTAISGAIASLVEKDLIRVENWKGEELFSAQLRRQSIGRLYFRPGDKWITQNSRDIAKAETNTTYRRNNIYKKADGRRSGGLTRVSQVVGSQQTLYDHRKWK